MRICQIEIRKFRGISQGQIVLPEHGVLLGPNNAGKSTIVEALAILFGRERMVRPISDWDFFGGMPKPESRFYIIATVTGFSHNDPTEVPNWFIGENLARPVWWHEDTSVLSTEADPPEGALLAAQIAFACRYDDETCEFETARYFYHGEADPFTDGYSPVPSRILRDVGFFLLSSNREWDKLLSFSSSSLLKVIREHDAIPGKVIEDIKLQLRNDVAKVEEAAPLSDILAAATKELQSFSLINESGKIAYRPTLLDTVSILQSLVAHVLQADGSLLPVGRHGAGTVSLQAFLLLLAFAEQRRISGRNFILAAEEPELHLHPSLHERLVHRIRSSSVQSIITTQSPHVAAAYQPHQVVFVQNTCGQIRARPLRAEPIKKIAANSIKKLYTVHRREYYEALMGGIVLVPEGVYDHEWLCLWQRIAQSSPAGNGDYDLRPITIIPTNDAAIAESFQEVATLRPDAIPIVDGDTEGGTYITTLSSANLAPSKIIRYGEAAAVECLSAWILEPALAAPGEVLSRLLPEQEKRTLRNLQRALVDSKKDRELRESLAWESLETSGCCQRACEFFHDLAAIATGGKRNNNGWEEGTEKKVAIFKASHIRRM